MSVLKRIGGEVIIRSRAKNITIKELVERAVKERLSLQGADLWGADLQYAYLQSADLCGANLQYAYLQSAYLQGADLCCANLQSADLCGANLQGADLWGANLQGAYLWGADLRGAKFCVTMLLMANWGELSNKLTLELMRHDAESCGEKAMTAWAEGGGDPFNGMQRDFLFVENKELWRPGKPKLRGIALLTALAKEKGIKL